MILNIAPKFDEPTEYSYKWNLKLMEELGDVEKVELLEDRATRLEFEDSVKVHDPSLIVFYDHGDETSLIAQEAKGAILDLKNVDLVKGREVYTMCCLAAKVLGVEAYKKGCKAWFGYIEVFGFTTTDEDMFREAANYGLILRVKQKLGWKECKRKVIEKFNELIDRATDAWTRIWLRHDRDALRCWDGEAPEPEVIPCPLRRFAYRLLGKAGLKLSRKTALGWFLALTGWGIIAHDFAHQVWELKGTVFSLEGGYAGLALLLMGFFFLTYEHILSLRKY